MQLYVRIEAAKKGVQISGHILYGNRYGKISLDRDLISFRIEGIAVQHHQYMLLRTFPLISKQFKVAYHTPLNCN